MSGPPAPPSDASTVDAMIAHQVILVQNDDPGNAKPKTFGHRNYHPPPSVSDCEQPPRREFLHDEQRDVRPACQRSPH